MSSRHLTFFVLLFLSVFAQLVRCQNVNDYSDFDNPAVRSLIAQLVYSRISNLTTSFSSDIRSHSSFCIKDSDADWNRTFDFSNNLDFVSSCIQKTRGDITRRLCTAAETRLYFKGLFGGEKHGNHLRPNRNCNLSSWLSGCEPGWSCSSGSDQKVDLRESNVIPSRTLDCQPCCEGFFCPHGLTCMIPCPLGSYCPLATLNKTAGVCEPYLYQLPQGRPNHSCGGANTWADVGTGSELFCSSGSYCPTTVERLNCTSGHYCRLGSTSERRCFQLASCGSNTKNQDIEAYGILLITGLGTLLLIIYNCSDQVLSTKERRVAKSRAAAAKSARQTAKARQRWKSAKTNVMKGASGLQAQLSKTFSRKRDTMSFEKLSKGEVSPSGPSDEMETMPRIEDHAGNAHSSNADSDPGNMTKGKKISTQSQIFKYAYNQLEREKAQQQELKDMSFSGVIKMATGNQIKNRPLIEISFRDLTLTLKTKKKALLRCVTGDIKPGRVTSVMGPSGAGKTTLLSAIAGKATGCKITGSILINGKRESVHSYKKIIGFVPQDDIVHGNLTVEENLWFSAISRLPVDLVKADRFLVVERVIESLGLEGVRNSLVGTVEKRGISGGQRKRVNVGLEMVMEPSLLLLDEPTSGLDSASSQQLLRAVRREALEGVNVCMVVHQPSYALFNMFDDLILLAKGGLTVYHGPVKHVEDYFADLGIVVPERVNPPDYFIDILEGIVSPKKDASLDYKELPLRWMVYKGYRVPGDMKPDLENIASSSTALESSHQTDVLETHGNDEHSFAGDLWRDVKSNVELHREKIRLNFSSSEDLAKRKTPGVFQQYRYFLGRVGKQRLREAKIQAVDYLILLLAGACLGSLSRDGDRNFGSAGYTYTIIGVSLLCKISALRSFSLDKLHYWRESSSGMSSLAYFLAKDTIDHFNTVVKPVVYLSTYYFLTNPRSSFADNYVVLLCLVYCVTGIAYALAISFEQGGAQLWSVLLPVVLTLVATRTNGNEIVKSLANLCYPRWALEAFVISNAERYSGVWLITRCGSLLSSGYSLHDWSLCVSILILIGVIGRVVAFFCMIVFQKK